MKTRSMLLAASILAAGLIANGAENANPPSKIKDLAESNNQFALDLYGKLSAEKGNLFFSPYSISTALAMTYAGARGDTEKEMTAALHLKSQAETPPAFSELATSIAAAQGDGVQMEIANSLWPSSNDKLLPEYLQTIKQYYHAPVFPTDYAKAANEAVGEINKWVEEKTHGKIKNLIAQGSLNSMTKVVLVNAIYFKGKWAEPFIKERTESAEFTRSDGSKKQVQMMSAFDTYVCGESATAKYLELPYMGDRLSMFICLPNSADGLPQLEKSIKEAFKLDALRKRTAQVFIPKFKMTWGTQDITDQLEALGVREAFSSEKADFSGMTGSKGYFINHVFHKAFVEVNEEGTEAVAATGMAVGATSFERPFIFRVDHPFIFLIRDKVTGSILFMGRVEDPE